MTVFYSSDATGAALIVTRTPPSRVGRAMALGRLRCSSCGGKLRPWGYARQRWLRDRSRLHRIRPRRGRCSRCRRTHVVLPDWLLPRRLDRVEVIGAALAQWARGAGFRTISRGLGLPATTVRGWIRRFAARRQAGRERAGDEPASLDRAPTFESPTAVSTQPALVSEGDDGRPHPAPPAAVLTPGARWRAENRATNGQLLASGSALSAG